MRLRTLAFATFLVLAVTDWRLCFLALMTTTQKRSDWLSWLLGCLTVFLDVRSIKREARRGALDVSLLLVGCSPRFEKRKEARVRPDRRAAAPQRRSAAAQHPKPLRAQIVTSILIHALHFLITIFTNVVKTRPASQNHLD